MVHESWILYHTGDFPYYSVPVSLKDSFYMIYQTHMETGSIIISKYDPCLLLMSSCKIAKTIKVDKIIINTSSVSKESLTSSRFKIGNLLLWFSLLVIFEKKWFLNRDQNAELLKNWEKMNEICDHVPEQILTRTNMNFHSIRLDHLKTETRKILRQSHVMHLFLLQNSPTTSFCQKIFSIVLNTSESFLHINQCCRVCLNQSADCWQDFS